MLVIAVAALTVVARIDDAQARAPDDAPSWLEAPVVAPPPSFELHAATGYSRAYTRDTWSGNGLGFEAGVGLRASAHWSLGVLGQYSEVTDDRSVAARTVVVGVAGTYHLMPYRRLDPWVELGSGYRMLWPQRTDGATGTNDTITHAFEIVQARVGVDLRLATTLAVAPFFAGAADWLDDRLAAAIFAGMQGRFDLAGTFAGDAE